VSFMSIIVFPHWSTFIFLTIVSSEPNVGKLVKRHSKGKAWSRSRLRRAGDGACEILQRVEARRLHPGKVSRCTHAWPQEGHGRLIRGHGDFLPPSTRSRPCEVGRQDRVSVGAVSRLGNCSFLLSRLGLGNSRITSCLNVLNPS
jgi:hypothetical protein